MSIMKQIASTTPGKVHVVILDTNTGHRARKQVTFYPGGETAAVRQARAWADSVVAVPSEDAPTIRSKG